MYWGARQNKLETPKDKDDDQWVSARSRHDGSPTDTQAEKKRWPLAKKKNQEHL